MPPRVEAGTPEGHSLALFSDDHPARHEVDHALALVADPGAAGDIHRFRLSMKRKQDLFARMRDLDIAWNDWLAEAEGIDSRIRASNITSRDSERTWTTWRGSLLSQFHRRKRADLRRPATPASSGRHSTTKRFARASASIAKGDMSRGSARGRMSSAGSTRPVVAFQSTIWDSEQRARREVCTPPAPNLMTA
ncbi:hypothetical protein EDB87DRAFT_1582626 [Lactarius vividus]|nr:hypothetical protein EDB87DRAFT_1582626 [Lactarius vividus]